MWRPSRAQVLSAGGLVWTLDRHKMSSKNIFIKDIAPRASNVMVGVARVYRLSSGPSYESFVIVLLCGSLASTAWLTKA